jgi:outer membrane protein TolC
MRRTSFILLVLLAATGTVAGHELNLEESVATALANNPEVRAAEARADAARARLDSGRSHRLPKIGLSESFVYTDNPAEVFALTLNQERFDIEEFFLSDPNSPEPLSTWITRVDLELPVYTGGKLSARIGQARSMATAEELSLDHTRQRVAFETITAYINLAKALEYIEVIENARQTTAEHVRLAERFAARGVILEADLLQARVHLAHMDEMLTTAENGARLARAALNFQMGQEQSMARRPTTLAPVAPVGGDLESWTAAALDNRSDLAAARERLEAGRLDAKTKRPGYIPEVAVVGNYGLYDDTIFGSNGSSGTIMAVAKISLFGGGSNGAEQAAARHETRGHEAEIRRFEEGVELAVRQAWHDLETARSRQATAHSALAAAEESLRVRDSRFKQGLDRVTDLLDAETALREAQLRELVARYDVTLDTFRLRFVSGAPLMDTMEDPR